MDGGNEVNDEASQELCSIDFVLQISYLNPQNKLCCRFYFINVRNKHTWYCYFPKITKLVSGWDWNLNNLIPDCTFNHRAILPLIISLHYSQREQKGRICTFQVKSGFLQRVRWVDIFFSFILFFCSLPDFI